MKQLYEFIIIFCIKVATAFLLTLSDIALVGMYAVVIYLCTWELGLALYLAFMLNFFLNFLQTILGVRA